jgi:Ca-activated chloride channel homolog
MTILLLEPWWLLLLPLALLPLWRHRRAQVRVGHADLGPAQAAGVSLAARLRWIPPLARSLAVFLLIVAIARPVKADEQTRVRVEGIAIQMLVDRSGSMRALDFTLRGAQVDRLTAIKSVARAFVLGDETDEAATRSLGGRPNDLVGLVTFARYADGISPLTLDHDHLVAALDRVQFAGNDEDGTAIGDALALGVERLKDVRVRGEGDAQSGDAGTIVRSRVLILLTDGENTAGDIDPDDAAKLAETFGIRIYTIGVGTNGFAPLPIDDPFAGRFIQRVPVTIDEALLRRIAERTGGAYFRATDTASLASIYAEIDRLERTETESRRYLSYADFAVESVDIGPFSLPPILAGALLLLAFELLLVATRFRSLT